MAAGGVADAGGTAEFLPGVAMRRRRGPGATVLWIHGYTIDSSLWVPIWDLLPDFSHIGIDMPGHGASSPLSDGETLKGLGERLGRAALDEGARHVVGLSLGAMLALELALGRPGAFESLCLAAPALAGGPADDDVGRHYSALAAAHRAGERGPDLRRRWMRAPPDLFRHAARRPELWTDLAAVIDRHRWEEFSGPGVARLATETQPLGALSALACRTLVLLGEHEFPAFRATAEIVRARVGGCRVAVLPQAGHLCLLEAPDLSAGLLRRHWARPTR